MSELTPPPNETRHLLRRVVDGLSFALVSAFAVSGYLVTRSLVWGMDSQLDEPLTSGLIIGGCGGLVLGAAYVVVGRWLRFDWLSVQLGALLGMGLYGVVAALRALLAGDAEPLRMPLMQGAVDGIFIGALVGVSVAFLSGQPVRLTPAGCGRYLLLSLAVLVVFTVVTILVQLGGGLEQIAIPVGLVLMVALGVITHRLRPQTTSLTPTGRFPSPFANENSQDEA